MRIEISGDVELRKNFDFFELFGSVEVVRGQYDMLGKTFVIDEGAISFQGGEDMMPHMDIKASYSFRNQQRIEQNLSVQITGTAESPEVKFQLDGSSVSEGDEIDNETGKITRLEEKIRNEVLDLGYFGNTTVKIVPISREKANIQISVLEFPVIKEIVFEGEDIIPRQEIIDTMQTKKGEQLNVNTFKEDLVRLRELFYEKGVMLGQNSNITLSKEFDKVIVKTHKAIVNSIDIVGNTKSKDYVIRREIELETGDVYDFVDLRRSYQNLVNTGYFKKIDFLPEVDSAGNVDLDVKVEEEETGSFRFGGTYGSENGLSGLIEVKDKNFKGRGYSLQLKAEFGGVDSYEFSYFNPRWHNKKRSLGVNIYDTKYDRDKYDLFGNYLYSYDEKRKGFSLSWGTNITRFTKFGIACYDEKISIEPVSLNIPDDHSQTISVPLSIPVIIAVMEEIPISSLF